MTMLRTKQLFAPVGMKKVFYTEFTRSGIIFTKMKVPGMEKSKLDPRFKLAKVILIIVHNNTEEESLFSRVKKNLPRELVYLFMEPYQVSCLPIY